MNRGRDEGERTAVVDDSRAERYGSPRARRRLVAATVVLYGFEVAAVLAAFGVGIALDVLVAMPVGLALAVALALGQVVLIARLKAGTHGVSDSDDQALDEHQLHVRGQVYTRAFHVGLSVLGVLAVLPVLWTLAGGARVDLDGWESSVLVAPVLLAFQLLAMTPTLVAARHEHA